jgi:hypothetical protein
LRGDEGIGLEEGVKMALPLVLDPERFPMECRLDAMGTWGREVAIFCGLDCRLQQSAAAHHTRIRRKQGTSRDREKYGAKVTFVCP